MAATVRTGNTYIQMLVKSKHSNNISYSPVHDWKVFKTNTSPPYNVFCHAQLHNFVKTKLWLF